MHGRTWREQSVDLGTVTVQPSLGVRKLQAVVTDRVGVAPQKISASLARPRRQHRMSHEEDASRPRSSPRPWDRTLARGRLDLGHRGGRDGEGREGRGRRRW